MKRSTILALAAVALACVLIAVARRDARRREATRVPPPPPPHPAPGGAATRQRGQPAAPSEQELIEGYLRSAIYGPFVNAAFSGARLVRRVDDQRTFSVMACTGNVVDHVGMMFMGPAVFSKFSVVRNSAVLPHDHACLTPEKLDTLQFLCFECARSTGRDPFECRIEFGDDGMLQVSSLVREGADAARRVIRADLKTGKILRDSVESETDMLVPSHEPPGPPGTLGAAGAGAGARGTSSDTSAVSGIDHTIFWDDLSGRAATARPAAAWPGLKRGHDFYGAVEPPALTPEDRIRNPRF